MADNPKWTAEGRRAYDRAYYRRRHAESPDRNRLRDRLRYQADRTGQLERARRRYQARTDEGRQAANAAGRAHYAADRERRRELNRLAMRKWRAAHPEYRTRQRRHAQAWAAEHPGWVLARRRSYDVARTQAETLALVAAARCFYCRSGEADTADHFYPVAWLKNCPERLPPGMDRTNIDAISNIRPACHLCNSSKGARDPYEFIALMAEMNEVAA